MPLDCECQIGQERQRNAQGIGRCGGVGLSLDHAYAWHGTCSDRSMRYLHLHSAGNRPVIFTPLWCTTQRREARSMDRPRLAPTPHDNEALYVFIGRVSLLLVEHNVDAITATMFLREIVE